MALSDIQALLDDPRETLGVEIKRWLDLDNRAVQADLARELIALANHGGGWLLFGFEESPADWAQAELCPFDAGLYSPDAINNICKRYADPTFQCDVRRLRSSAGNEHVVIEVPGGHGVPIRTKRGGPEGSKLRIDTYYVRRSGPETAPVGTAYEWDALLKRCISNQREDLLDGFRAIVHAVGAAEVSRVFPALSNTPLTSWRREARARVDDLKADQPPSDGVDPYALGTVSAAYRLVGISAPPTKRELMDALYAARGDESGWPVWVMLTRPDLKPYVHDDAIEFWMPFGGPGQADYWRVAPSGYAYLIRGHREDHWHGVEPGTALDPTVAVRLTGECLLHASRLAATFGAGGVEFSLEWTGLRGRTLQILGSSDRWLPEHYVSQQDAVERRIETESADISDALPELVRQLLDPLFETFDLFEPSPKFYAEELARMRRRR